MRSLVVTSICVLFVINSNLLADEGTPPEFMKPGEDYILRFAGQSPFRQTEGIPIEPEYYKKPNASVTSASITYDITVFTLVEMAGNSWALVEHPKSIKDAFKWNFKRLAMAALTPHTIALLEATEEGQKQLQNLRKQAAIPIETDKTWVNMNHIVAIKKPPTEPQEYKLKMSVKK